MSAPSALPFEQHVVSVLKAKCARKRSSSKSPTARTLELLRKEGWTAGVVEQTIRGAGRIFKRDLFGFADVSAVRAGTTGTLYVQTTSGAHHAERRAKILACKEAAIVLAAHNRIEVWTWAKQGARGKRKTWIVRRESLSLSDFVQEAA